LRAPEVQNIAELELSIRGLSGDKYPVEFRFYLPRSETEVRSLIAEASIDLAILQRHLIGSDDYGKALTSAFFTDAELRVRFTEALTVARENQTPLRLRLSIDPQAMELHSIAWETLRNPQDDTPLSTNPNIIFSRYLSSLDWRPVSLRHQERMNALALFANPSNLEDYQLARFDVPAELDRLRQAMGVIPLTALGLEAGGEAATLDNLFERLRQRKPDGLSYFDILVLVCHGSLNKGEPHLWLEGDDGKAHWVAARELETRFKELPDMPMLVVLASCESAKAEAGQALSALGPRLSQAGVPAVLAMQGKISQETNNLYTSEFFSALQAEGVVDLAASLARGQVRERLDYWMPALFMRLRSGRIWYTPGFGSEASDTNIWESLKTFIDEEMCTLLLGPEIIRSILGDGREIALKWSELHGYPFYNEDRDKLPRVAQFVSIFQNVTYLRIAYQKALREALLRGFPSAIPEELAHLERWKPEHLLQALDSAGAVQWASIGNNPYSLLAGLGLRIYLTGEQGNLLQNALREAGREPEVRLCPWNATIRSRKALWYYNDDPTPQKPLVYHLFGHFEEPASLVFTEDDTYDYLINLTEHRDLIPDAVSAALADSALMFVGFQPDDWQFRLLFRLIMNQPGVDGLENYSHVAAQIAPREGLIEDADRARLYLQRYLGPKKIDLYWGSSQDFLSEMSRRLEIADARTR